MVLLPPMDPPPLTHTIFFVLFVQDGDGHAGPLGRVCPDGWTHLTVCVCVWVGVWVCSSLACMWVFPIFVAGGAVFCPVI